MTSAASPNLARIPAGDFLMAQLTPRKTSGPFIAFFVSEFFIGRFPVTQDEYARFVRATGHPAPAIRELPLIALGDRDTLFRELASAYVWDGDQPPAGARHAPGRARHLRGRNCLLRMVVSDARSRGPIADRGGVGAAAARAGVDGQRYPWGNDIDASRGNFLGESATNASAARGRPARIHPTPTGCTTSPATPGSGSPTGTAPTITAWATRAIRAALNRARCESSGADRG